MLLLYLLEFLGSHLLLLCLHYLGGVWGLLEGATLLNREFFLSIVYHALLFSLHYNRWYLGLLKYLIAGVVPSVSLGSHFLLPYY